MTGTPHRASLSERVLAGDRRALARLLTSIENDDPLGEQAMEKLFPHTGSAHLIGITGPPGGGKSTLVNEMIRAYREMPKSVAVIAIDPSSPLTGGAALGDRIRMQEWHADVGVFIRSMASRRFGGGLARNALAVAHAFDAAGFDQIIIETVGTGQDEVTIASLAMTTLLVQVPGTGDGVQTLKAGALEIGDVLVVTKGDRPESSDLARDLRNLRQLGMAAGSELSRWDTPVIKTSAARREGIDSLMNAIAAHRSWLQETGEMESRVQTMINTEITFRVQDALLQEIRRPVSGDGGMQRLVERVAAREVTPHQAADEMLARLRHNDTAP
ncbi:MAG TPA: methylmalonyl Co-A mutase-associated GTPase MeaB [Thermomicrobiales bacterium]|nr:methylmalonyl Co-A mutase-associated GTPase MeaB [Thermomicrobiales bacterium]